MTLHLQRLAATGDSRRAPELVLIHGWGMSSVVWAGWLPLLRGHCNITLLDLPGYGASEPCAGQDIDALLERIIQVLPERAVYVGYSLGGMLAVRMAVRFPGRVQGLVTLASNARFVADNAWPWAMPAANFEQFADALANPAVALKRFAGLQVRGCGEEKSLHKLLRGMQEPVAAAVLSQSLQWLEAIDLRADIKDLSVPARFCFAECDALVPVVAAQQFPAADTRVVSGAAHAMFLSHPSACAALVLDFLRGQQTTVSAASPSALRKKQDVARSFSRAAATYDGVAELQRRVGDVLLEKNAALFLQRELSVVDLGCGTGYFTDALKQQAPQSRVIGVDLAEGMVRHASLQRSGDAWLCADAENLPLAEHSVDVIFSSLALQWCENIDALFAEAFRVLVPGGRLLFSTLGSDTLHELRSAWRRVDDRTHVNPFTDWQVLRDSMARAGFQCPAEPDEECITMEYNTVRELAGELKCLGAHNLNSGRPVGLTGKQRIAGLKVAYELQRNTRGLLPATYQIWYGAVTRGD